MGQTSNTRPVAQTKKKLKSSSTSATRNHEEIIRSAPLASILSAAAFGFFLQLLPLGRIVALFFRVVFALIKPAIVIFGAVKLVSFLLARGTVRQ